jgi:hypothetical protein
MTPKQWEQYLAQERALIQERADTQRAQIEDARQAHEAAVRYYYWPTARVRYWDKVDWDAPRQNVAPPTPPVDPNAPPSAGRSVNTPRHPQR